MMLHIYNNQPTNQWPYEVSTAYTLWIQGYSLENILKLNVPTAILKVKSRSHHSVAHLHPQPMCIPSINKP